MLNSEKIKEIITQRNHLTFIEQFKKFRDEAHVEYYEVDLKKRTRTYGGSGQTYVEQLDSPSFNCADIFDEAQIKRVLDQRRNQKIGYLEFLAEMAMAGVISYRVDMKKNSVSYRGNAQEYTETIPV